MLISIPIILVPTLKVVKVNSLRVFQPLCECVLGTHPTKYIHEEKAQKTTLMSCEKLPDINIVEVEDSR